MNKYFKHARAALAFSLFVLLYFVTSVFVYASDVNEPTISFDIDPRPVVATIVFIFGLLIAVILALVFLIRHISGTKERLYRLSKIKSEDTVQLYDDLDDEKWVDEKLADRPRDVHIEDENAKPAAKAAKSTAFVPQESEKKPHGPIPERDMPGYDPRVHGMNDDIDPVSPFGPVGSYGDEYASAQGTRQAAPEAYQPGRFAPAMSEPIIYKPDSEVEIIMQDSASSDNEAASVNIMYNTVASSDTPDAEQSETAPTRVRAIRRRGKVPGLVTRATPTSPYVRRRAPVVDMEDNASASEPKIPNLNFRHVSITPRSYAPVEEFENVTSDVLSEDLTLKVNGLAESVPVTPDAEPVREAPIFDIADAEKGSADVTVKLVTPSSVTEVSESSVRTLADVLEELDAAEDDVTELEVIERPVVEEELVFLGAGDVTDDVDSDDDIFASEEGEARMFLNGKYSLVRYKTSFLARFIQSEEKLQDYYSVLKNVFMSYKGVEASLGWSCENFTYGGDVCAKINVVDKMLLLYLALDPERYHNYKYNYSYSSYKYKGSKVPMFVKIKSERALKYALELIIALMSDLALESGEMPDIDYRRPYETVPALIDRGLIRILASENASEKETDINTAKIAEKLDELEEAGADDVDRGAVFDFEDAPETMVITIDEPVKLVSESVDEARSLDDNGKVDYEPTEQAAQESAEKEILLPDNIVHVNAQSADLLLSDEEAIASIELVDDAEHREASGKIAEVNLDTICQAFNDGDVVNLETLKAKRLVGRNVARVKILARGTMTKTLTIYADRFSLQAVKMITLAGGHAEQYR
ncbi:MAG: uL15 family ribosomal protein [Clostridia bacterium]|nr:uL15 family ribosomal protein [Clostridia bacterium]